MHPLLDQTLDWFDKSVAKINSAVNDPALVSSFILSCWACRRSKVIEHLGIHHSLPHPPDQLGHRLDFELVNILRQDDPQILNPVQVGRVGRPVTVLEDIHLRKT